MPTLRQIVDGNTIYAYGTSEGAKRGWDSRGRSSEEKTANRNREIARYNPAQTSLFGPGHVEELQKRQRDKQQQEKAKAAEKAGLQRDAVYQRELERRSGVDAGKVPDEIEQEENGAGMSAH
jgi:hypothetical protein